MWITFDKFPTKFEVSILLHLLLLKPKGVIGAPTCLTVPNSPRSVADACQCPGLREWFLVELNMQRVLDVLIS